MLAIKFKTKILPDFVLLNCLQRTNAVYYNILVREGQKGEVVLCKEELSGSTMKRAMAL